MNPFHVATTFLLSIISLIITVKAGSFVSRPFKRGRFRSLGFKAFLLGAVFCMFFGAACVFSLLVGPRTRDAGTWLLVNLDGLIFCVTAWLNIAATDL